MKKLVQKIKDTLSILNSGKGFTLIEMLVVILIIGILAAIALPQYQLVVNKSKYMQMVNMVRALGNAQEEYYLIHNEYTGNLEDLSVTLPEGLTVGAEGRYFIGDCGLSLNSNYMSGILFKGKSDQRIASYTFYYKFYTGKAANSTRCTTYSGTKDLGDKICQSLGGELISNKYSKCGTTGNTTCNQYNLYNH